MLFADHRVVIRGGGDLGTGVAYRMWRAGFPIVVLDLPEPLAIRRAVAVSTAVETGRVTIEGLEAVRASSVSEAGELAGSGRVAVLASSDLPDPLDRFVLVDARLAKQNLDTHINQAPLVIGLGPGFTAGVDCHAVVETERGHHLGRVLTDGSAAPNTGIPGVVGGASSQRVIRAVQDGAVSWTVQIGDTVVQDQSIGQVGSTGIRAAIGGVARGLIAEGRVVKTGTKIADIDPRGDPAACFEVSDKALAVGGGVLEAVLARLNDRS